MLEEHRDNTFSIFYSLLIVKNTIFYCYYITSRFLCFCWLVLRFYLVKKRILPHWSLGNNSALFCELLYAARSQSLRCNLEMF